MSFHWLYNETRSLITNRFLSQIVHFSTQNIPDYNKPRFYMNDTNFRSRASRNDRVWLLSCTKIKALIDYVKHIKTNLFPEENDKLYFILLVATLIQLYNLLKIQCKFKQSTLLLLLLLLLLCEKFERWKFGAEENSFEGFLHDRRSDV